MNRRAIQGGGSRHGGGIGALARGQMHHSGDDFAPMHHGNGDGEQFFSDQETAGAIDRVDDEQRLTRPACRIGVLFRQPAISGPRLPQLRRKQGVDRQISLADRTRALGLFPDLRGLAPESHRLNSARLCRPDQQVQVTFRQASALRPEGWAPAPPNAVWRRWPG